jgi:hypothetical protein
MGLTLLETPPKTDKAQTKQILCQMAIYCWRGQVRLALVVLMGQRSMAQVQLGQPSYQCLLLAPLAGDLLTAWERPG